MSLLKLLKNVDVSIKKNSGIRESMKSFHQECHKYKNEIDKLASFFSENKNFFIGDKPKLLYIKFLIYILYNLDMDYEFNKELLLMCLEENSITGIIYLTSLEALNDEEIYLEKESVLQFCNPNRFTFVTGRKTLASIKKRILEINNMWDGTISNTLLHSIIQ